ncbi:hypothetical protein LC087_02420 [Bacillus carboniphilus]|uniref:ABC transporter permease n=1 Tax=Bacillus carboniphilus TaxID=86663 RepID=A0ABY9JUK4_9BACI|nr:hypothetical protein [Bacillus carboniphilus]WLR43086.1 hypothetical protein LC087_02420 [Bacillus carboniphilus]
MKEFRTLQFLDHFTWFFTKMGVDYPMMRKIVQMKLTMDQRRTPTIFQSNAKKAKENKEENKFMKSLWVYGLMGLLLIFFVLLNENYILSMSVTFSVLMITIMMSMVSDFSNVLLDIREKMIISSKPISSKTINTAKTIHIAIYLFLLTGSFVVPSLLASFIAHGPIFFLIYLLEIILMVFLIILCTSLIYVIILKFFDGEKVKDIINFIQIGLTIGIAIGYQLVIRSFDMFDFSFQVAWWQFFIPPIWFGASL